MAKKRTAIKYGVILGNISLSSEVKDSAAHQAKEYYEACEAKEFSGDDVQTALMPSWLTSFLPTNELAEQGFKVRAWGFKVPAPAKPEFLLTLGTEAHVDDIQGLTLCVVIHNDGLTFKQGRSRCTPLAGDWFVFDDSRTHEVLSPKDGKAVLTAVIVPIDPL